MKMDDSIGSPERRVKDSMAKARECVARFSDTVDKMEKELNQLTARVQTCR